MSPLRRNRALEGFHKKIYNRRNLAINQHSFVRHRNRLTMSNKFRIKRKY